MSWNRAIFNPTAVPRDDCDSFCWVGLVSGIPRACRVWDLQNHSPSVWIIIISHANIFYPGPQTVAKPSTCFAKIRRIVQQFKRRRFVSFFHGAFLAVWTNAWGLDSQRSLALLMYLSPRVPGLRSLFGFGPFRRPNSPSQWTHLTLFSLVALPTYFSCGPKSGHFFGAGHSEKQLRPLANLDRRSQC